ncbi:MULTISPECIES: hypothetical protein [Ramlibacter]|uniref:DUF883 domain-containing protein n=1 Tax=Ramlibacter aquaticus TaxID=2780094 RepID=A0ABR9SHW7_9BURK|nr:MULTISPECIES: hypothetical protein [Ramlibacter]MBE7941935.1 hypothetical protein [Ramlibacter aquaticus]
MNSDTASSSPTIDTLGTGTMGSTGTGTGTSGTAAGRETVQKAAQKAHAAVDSMAETLGSSADRVMGWQQEYGEAAREQIRANPLAVVAGAFAIGYIMARMTR